MTAISPNVVVTILLKLKEDRLGECCVAQLMKDGKPFAFNLKCKSLNSHFAHGVLPRLEQGHTHRHHRRDQLQ